MKIPVTQQLQRTDFPEAPGWISKLLYPLQLFMTTIVTALTNQLTLQDNMSCVVSSTTLTAGATADKNLYQFVWPYNRQPIELTIHATRTDGTYVQLYPVVSWNLVGSNISVNGVQGLTPGIQFNLVTVVK